MNFDLIEKKRIAKKLSVSALCELAGIDRSTYYNIKDNPDSATFSTATKLVQALDLNVIEKSQVFN